MILIAPLLLYFSNHVSVFFAGLFEFSVSVFRLFLICEFKNLLTSVYRINANNFRIGGGNL